MDFEFLVLTRYAFEELIFNSVSRYPHEIVTFVTSYMTYGYQVVRGNVTCFSGATQFLRSIPAVHFASTGATYFEAGGVHGASVL